MKARIKSTLINLMRKLLNTSNGKLLFFNFLLSLNFYKICPFFRWHDKKPIWASAAQAGMNFSTYLWSRCDVKWHDVKTEKPSFCESIYRKDDSKTMFINMEVAVIHFQTGQADGAIVSTYLKVSPVLPFFYAQKIANRTLANTVKVGTTVLKNAA